MDAPTATEQTAYVRRFSPTERSLHWLLAGTFFAMLVTGLILYLPSLAQVAADRQLWKSIHLGAAIAFWGGTLLLLVSAPGELQRTARELDSFDEDDRRWLRWAVRRGGTEPPQGRFNAGQKLNALVTAAFAVLFAISGFFLWLGERDHRYLFDGTGTVHDALTLISVGLVSGHLYLALIHPATRHALRGMTLGDVREDWAREHHSKWLEDRRGL